MFLFTLIRIIKFVNCRCINKWNSGFGWYSWKDFTQLLHFLTLTDKNYKHCYSVLLFMFLSWFICCSTLSQMNTYTYKTPPYIKKGRVYIWNWTKKIANFKCFFVIMQKVSFLIYMLTNPVSNTHSNTKRPQPSQ